MKYSIPHEQAEAETRKELRLFGAKNITVKEKGSTVYATFEKNNIVTTYTVELHQSARDNLCAMRDAIRGLRYLEKAGLTEAAQAASNELVVTPSTDAYTDKANRINLLSMLKKPFRRQSSTFDRLMALGMSENEAQMAIKHRKADQILACNA
ncbi:MAG: hypothetical protein AAF720_00960 [Pseudomonadota bacterium]